MLPRLVFAAAVGALAHAWREPGDNRPNIVFFFPDTISAESMGIYGHPVAETPNFDAFAAENTLFETAISSYPQCSPSRCALATGRHIHVLGHRTMTHLLQPWETNIWQLLKDSNYTTIHLGKNDMLAQASFNLSFTYWSNVIGQDQGTNSFPYRDAGYYSFMSDAGKTLGNQSQSNRDLLAVQLALGYMASPDFKEPCAIFLPGIGAHPPYGAPKDWYDKYNATQLQEMNLLRPQNVSNKPPYIGDGGIRFYRNYSSFDDAFSYKVLAQYLARVSYTDWIFGQLVNGLKQLPQDLQDRTSVVFSSDHGDFQGNYGLVEKWSGAGDDLLLRVPLAIKLPKGWQQVPGSRVSVPVQLLDLFATFLELGGLNVTDFTYVHFANSLVPFAQQSPLAQRHQYVFAEAGYLYDNEIEYNDPTQWPTWNNTENLYWPRGQEEHLAPSHSVRFVVMRNESYKLIYRPSSDGVSELYNLSADPRELDNVFGQPQYAQVQSQFLFDMLTWFINTADVTEDIYDSRDLPPSPQPPPGFPSRPGQTEGEGVKAKPATRRGLRSFFG
jgi:arylsulfatase A-like enzyme